MEAQNLVSENTKDFQCPICQKYFSRKFTLDMHLLIHKGIKPHPCPFCGKCFRQRGTLMRHKALHSANNLFFCNLCNRGFRQKNVFLHHLKHRHSVSTETLDRRRHRTQLKDYESIMDTLPSFVLANSTAISTSEKDLDVMLLEAMNGIACESSSKTMFHDVGNHNSDNELDPTSLQNANSLIDKSDESVQELRYECELCCVKFLDFTSYRLHVEEEHDNDVELLDQKPFLFSVMSENEPVYLRNAHVPAQKEKMPPRDNLSYTYQGPSKNFLTFFEKSSKVKNEDNKLECTLCHSSFMSEEDFGLHVDSHMEKILIENVNTQENGTAISDLSSASSNFKNDINSASCGISSIAKSLPDEAKFTVSKDLILDSPSKTSVNLPVTTGNSLLSNKDSNALNALFRCNNKQFKCPTGKCFCSNDTTLKKHTAKHKLQKMLRKQSCHLKKNNLRILSLSKKGNKSKKCFSTGAKIGANINYRRVYFCSICTKTFKRIALFEYHRQMHLSARSFCCGQCKHSFSDKQSLLLHTRSKHLKAFRCSSCSRSFSYRTLFDLHVKKCLKSEVLLGLKSNMDLPLVDLKELSKSNVEGLIGVIPLCHKKSIAENFKIGIPIFAVQHVKNIEQLPLLSVP